MLGRFRMKKIQRIHLRVGILISALFLFSANVNAVPGDSQFQRISYGADVVSDSVGPSRGIKTQWVKPDPEQTKVRLGKYQTWLGWLIVFLLLRYAFLGSKRRGARPLKHEPAFKAKPDSMGASQLAGGYPNLKDGVIDLELLSKIEWRRFEELVAAYYREIGFEADIGSFGGDGGIDVTVRNPLGETSFGIQCKSWASLVGVKVVRELFGSIKLAKLDSGFIFARGEFSSDAIREAESLGITLVKGAQIIKMIQSLPVDGMLRLFKIATEGDFMTPSCAACGTKMTLQTKRPAYWMCSKHPKNKIYVALK